MLNMMALKAASPPSEQALGGRVRCHIRGRKTEPVGVKTDGLAKSEAYGLWQYDMTSRRCRQIARVEIQTHALHIYTHNTI